MHPSPSYAWTDREEMLAFVQAVSFSTIFVTGPDGPMLVHVPVLVAGPDKLRFHVFRGNRAAASLAGARALLSCLGPDAYISPDWYGLADQVPTWNYVTVECEGPLRAVEGDELAALLDALSAEHEARLFPKPPWTKEKMSAGRFEALVKAIVGYEMTIEELRGTRKLGQDKQPEFRLAAAAGVAAADNEKLAELMRESAR